MMRSKTARPLMAAFVAATALGASLAAQQITSKDIQDGFANPARWLTYSGDYTGQRHSPLKQITPANAGQLVPAWTFQTGVSNQKFEATPIVVDGTLYIAGPLNYAWAVEARTGKQLWRYQRTLPQGLRVCCGTVNRGFAILGDRLFLSTLDAHLVALDAKTGKEVWDVEMAKPLEGFAGTAAPLVVKDKVIVGIAGGEFAIRGFIDAYDPKTGARLWRRHTIPAPGEPGSDTWPAETMDRGGAPTWLTGTYDPELNLLYWGTGNPNPDLYGENRKGDNLYANSLLALDPDTGELKWHFQFTPHDTHDWDANQIPVLANLTIGGQPRKVVMLANRNGFFYVLDRTNGKMILAKPFVETTWAKEIAPDGRPIELPDQRPTPTGTKTCPDLFGGTNFMSPSFDPATGLFYVSARETCMTYSSAAPPPNYKAGDRTMGGMMRPEMTPRDGALRAIDAATGTRKWQLSHPSPSWAGVLSTAGGVVFTGDNEGYFIAADSKTGKELYRYQTGAPIYAPPTTYLAEGKQYVVMPSGGTVTAFMVR